MSFFQSDYKSRRLLVKLSFYALILTTSASLAVSVFAFSSSASLLQVDNLAISTISAAKIQLGLKNPKSGEIDYYDQLSKDSYTSSNLTGIEGRGLYPVSSSFKSQWLVKNQNEDYTDVTPMFTMEYPSNGNVTFPGNDGTKHYVQTEIFIKQVDILSKGVNLYLKDLTVSPNTTVNNSKAASINKANSALHVAGSDLDKIVDSLRISILTPDSYYIIDPNKDQETTLAGRLNISGDDEYYDTFGENYGANYTAKEALYGEYEGSIDKLVYNESSSTDSTLNDTSKEASTFNAKSKAGVKVLNLGKSIYDSVNNPDGVKLKSEDSVTVESLKYSASRDDNTILISLEPGEIKRIVISYYIEGWDLDCTDVIQYGSFTSSFQLTGVYKTY